MVWESEALAESVHTLLAQLGSWSLHALARFGSFGAQGNYETGMGRVKTTTKTLGRSSRLGGTPATWDWFSGTLNICLRAVG